MTKRKITDENMISEISKISEDVEFKLLLSEDTTPGTYHVAGNVGSLVDTFQIVLSTDPDTVIGSLNNSNPSFTSGNWDYTLDYDQMTQQLDLVVSLAEDADAAYRVWKYNADGTAEHAESYTDVSVNAEGSPLEMVVLKSGIVDGIELGKGGTLHYCSGATVTGLTFQQSDSYENHSIFHASFDGTEEGGKLTGTHQYSDFSYENKTAKDIVVFADSEVVAKNGILVDGLYLARDARISIKSGSTLTGTIHEYETSFHFWDTKVELHDSFMEDVQYIRSIGAYNLVIDAYDSELKNVNFAYADGVNIFEVDGEFLINAYDSIITDSNILRLGALRNTKIGNVSLTDLVVNGQNVQLIGDIVVSNNISGWYTLDANGKTITLDMTKRKITDENMISEISKIYNTDLVVIAPDAGTYRIASNASKIGTGDAKGVYNWDTNTWDFKGEVIGDMDGIIEIRDENGILLANCTVNGDTEYFGRYNYTVRVDDNGDMYLDVGWNTREGRTYAADGLDNLTQATAAALPEVGTKLTIDSADDVDWFKFTLETPGRGSSYIGIDFKQWAGDLDLYLYDAAGNQLDYAKSVTDNERISLKGLAAGDYYVKVEGYDGNVNEYKLAYNLPAPVVLNDEYELGNTPFSAVPLWTITGTKTVGAAIQTAEDVDYYSFVLTRKGTTADSVTLTFDTDFGDLDLYLYDISGLFLLGKSISTNSGTETISLAGLKNGLYVAKVVSKDGITVANYDLTFNVREKEVEPDKLEKGGNNNTLKRATDLHAPNEAGSIDGLSIHQHETLLGGVDADVDYYKFSLLEKGSADDWIGISYEVSFGDLDIEILNAAGEVVAYSRTAENEDTVSLKGFEVGDYYIRVSGYNNVANNYTLNWNVTNSSLIPSDSYEGMEPIAIRENQTITGLSIAKPVKEDETRADTFKIVLEYDAWKRSKIILTDYRSDWEDGMAYTLKDADGNVLEEGKDSEISLAGLKKGEYYLTVDTPNDDEYSEYSLIAQCLPDSDNAKDNTWSFFIYLAGDNNLEGAYLTELLNMQKAILPENVEVYVLMDRHESYSTAQRDWTDTRVGRIRHSNGGAIAVEWMYFDGVNTDTYMNTQNLEKQKEWDTGDIATLEAFLDWGMEVGRADHYALIMKDHGSSLGYNCEDDTDGSILAIDEIADLLRADKYKDLSVVAFDQCLMGSDVVISTMEGTVDYVVASEAVGYTPNLLVMYKVLLNSLETEMTPREVSQKIVAACNCSGLVDLTLASFKTDGHALSDALQAFGEAAKGFSREDWVAICKTFATAYNYGDEYWAYSDLGSFLSTLKEYSTSISGTLMEATENLYDVVLNQLIDSTMITPTVYGSGLAVFNPVLSNDVISFYATEIGQTAWGDFLRTTGQLSEDCTEFFVDTRTNLTFTDFSYSIEDEAVQVTYNLGTFTGNGVEYNGLYMDQKACFTVSLDQAGIEGDAIRVVADNPDANITVKLIQTRYIPFQEPEKTIRRTSTDGVLSLAGVDPAKAGVDTEYDLIITSDKETTYRLSFVADWTSGSDFFDYSRSGVLGAQGNGSIEKATKLAAGNYGGLVTYAGDPDFYQLNTVYSDTLNVTVNGTGLTVQEYDADGLLVQEAEYADGKYTIIVANGNYLRVEGNAVLNPASNQVDSYSLYISDVSSTYLSLGGTEIQLPEKPVVTDELKDNQVVVTIGVEDGMKSYQSSDLQVWNPCENDTFVAENNGLYYFKSVDPETKLESKFTSLFVEGIDKDAPMKPVAVADITELTNGNVTVTATFSDDSVKKEYSLDGETWQAYTEAVKLTENGTVSFRGIDAAGNISEVTSYEVTNIDKVAPVAPVVVADATELTNGNVTVTATFSDDSVKKEYSLDGETWQAYTEAVKLTENGTVSFRGIDAAGNISEVTSYEVTNIDKVAPVKPTAVADVTELTNTDVTVTSSFSEDSEKKEYSLDGETWQAYTEAVKLTENGTVSFRGIDAAGNVSDITSYTVGNIDKVAPVKPTAAADMTADTNGDVHVLASFSEDSVVKEYSLDGQNWQAYMGAVTLTENGSVYFRGTDAAGNISEVTTFEVTNIDKVAPVIILTGDNQTPLQKAMLTATVDDGSPIYYRIGDTGEWTEYMDPITVTSNATYNFLATDVAGNEGTNFLSFENIDTTAPVIALSGDNQTPLQKVTLTASTDDGSPIYYRIGDTGEWMEYKEPITVTDNATYNFLATDAAGNEGTNFLTFGNIIPAPISDVSPQTQTWEQVGEAAQYIVEYSMDNFEHVIQVTVNTNSLDSFQMPAGNYQMRVKVDGGDEWTVATPVVTEEAEHGPKLIRSNADGNADVFFVNSVGTWESGYVAQHVGSTADTWGGTNEYASVFDKNKLADIIEGSTDANVMLMTDDANGDALFVDDIYSASPDELGLSQSRIARIDEIRAGVGNDIVDMTSHRFEYTGDGLTIRGGDGNDTIWANKGDNFLFGDAGNDRIVGASGNDVITGGIGNDRMHGGGGEDIFTFCDNWGMDTVEQLAGGSVTLWFANGDESKWNAETLTYTDGDNTVTVKGVTSVTLKFGGVGEDAAMFATLSEAGAFKEFTSQKIFEENKGLLA